MDTWLRLWIWQQIDSVNVQSCPLLLCYTGTQWSVSHSQCEAWSGHIMALDVSAIVGIILMSVGTLMVAWGLVLCYTTKVSIFIFLLDRNSRSHTTYVLFFALSKVHLNFFVRVNITTRTRCRPWWPRRCSRRRGRRRRRRRCLTTSERSGRRSGRARWLPIKSITFDFYWQQNCWSFSYFKLCEELVWFVCS